MPDAVPAAESQDATATDPSSPSAEPVASSPAPSSIGTLAEAFRADPDGAALKAGGPSDRPDRPSDDDAPPEDSAAPDAASKSSETPGLSRRGAASAIREKDAEIERLVVERAAEKERAERAAERVTALERQQETARKAALEKIGDDADFERLQQARLRNRTLSYEEDERLDAMIAWREHASTLWDLADKAHKVSMARAVATRADTYGLDRETAFGSDLPGLLDHAVSRTEARVRAESAEEIASLKAELKGLRPRAAASRTSAPTTGGNSAPGGERGRMPDDGASPMDWFRAGAREQAAARPNRR